MTADTVVIGGGAIGLTLARALRARGKSVAMIERAPEGFNASCGNAGGFGVTEVLPLEMSNVLRNLPRWLLDPLGPVRVGVTHLPAMIPFMSAMAKTMRPGERERISRALSALLSRARADSLPLIDSLGLRSQLHERGALWVYETQKAFQADARDRDARRALGVEMQDLTAEEARRLEPALGPRVVAGVMTPQWMHLDDPAEIVRGLRAQVRAQGVDVITGEATAITGKEVLLSDGRRIPFSSEAIVAAGAWSGQLARSVGDRVVLDSERGYNRTIPDADIGLTREIIFAERQFVATPMSVGLRIGGAAEFRGLSGKPDYRRSAALAELAKRYFPDLKSTAGTDWMGHRPATPDSLPVIGASGGRADVFYAFGHGHVGLTLAATTATLLADLVTGRTPEVDLNPYAITRFSR